MSLQKTQLAVTRHVASGDQPIEGFMPFTPRAKQVLQQACEEAAALDHRYVGTEHILLALITVDEGVGMNVLRDFNLDAMNIRDTVIQGPAGFTHPTGRVASVCGHDGDPLPVPTMPSRLSRSEEWPPYA